MYKIIHDNKVVDVVAAPYFVRFLSSGNITFTNKSMAHGILGSDMETVYRFEDSPQNDFPIATIAKITEEEFNRLQSLLNSNQEIYADSSALTKAKRETIDQLSGICNYKIISGFSVTLSDGNKYDFKLTTEDQLNLAAIENQLNAGETIFIYHATGQPCRIFNREDMIRVIAAFRRYVMYHTTYFNIAKQYIMSLTDIEKIKLFTYGTDVSEAVDDKVLKQLLKNGGNIE